jgi:serine protease AprX
MKKTLLLLILCSLLAYPQVNDSKLTATMKKTLNSVSENENILVWVFFTDKGEQKSLMKEPRSVVSAQSLKRRAKVLPSTSLILDEDLPVSSQYINALESKGFIVKQKSKWFNGVSGYISIADIPALSSLSFVKQIDPVVKLKRVYEEPSGESAMKVTQPENVLLNYGSSYTQLQQINVPAVHNLGYFGQGVTICVMDAGFNRLSHESFSSMNIIAKWDFVNNDPGVGDSTDMGYGGHGTQTLSTIGGFKEGQLIGPAFQSNYILAKTENTDTETPVEEDNWIAALEWADSIGVDVTSTSLGYLTYDSPYPSYTWQNMDGNTARITIAGDLAVKRGIVVVNSAGNNGLNLTRNTLGAPADGDSIIAVGAVTSSGARSSFSSVGPTVDGRIKPDIMAMGSSVVVASTFSNNTYSTASGTSFSCPLAAGAAALVLSVNPNLTPMQVRDALRNTASKSTSPDNQMGWGIINTLNAVNYFPVPVELVSFTAMHNGSEVVLQWSTATEDNNLGFDIEKSSAGFVWEKIGFVNGNGTTTERNNYTFTDAAPLKTTVFYRLKQIDYDGKSTYSSVVSVDPVLIGSFELAQNYPNPFNPITKIRFTIPEEVSGVNVLLKVYDVLGNEVMVLVNEARQSGEYETELNASSLSGGVYFYTLSAGSFSSVKKFVLLK